MRWKISGALNAKKAGGLAGFALLLSSYDNTGFTIKRV
ncbi:Uncharacterised protein [Salmonella bongori]|nr:Uncharacterised protein [Salmonella bongori]